MVVTVFPSTNPPSPSNKKAGVERAYKNCKKLQRSIFWYSLLIVPPHMCGSKNTERLPMEFL